jgi:hypothetical protein
MPQRKLVSAGQREQHASQAVRIEPEPVDHELGAPIDGSKLSVAGSMRQQHNLTRADWQSCFLAVVEARGALGDNHDMGSAGAHFEPLAGGERAGGPIIAYEPDLRQHAGQEIDRSGLGRAASGRTIKFSSEAAMAATTLKP